MDGSDQLASERFELVRELGAGGMGTVYQVVDRDSGAVLALKTLQLLDPVALSLFKNEFRSLSGIVHPNLVTLHELVAEGGRWFLTMDLIKGRSWLDWLWGDGEGAPQTLRPRPKTDDPQAIERTLTLLRKGGPATFEKTMTLDKVGGPAGLPDSDGGLPTPPLPESWAPPELDEDTVARLRDSLGQLVGAVGALHAAGKLHHDLKPSNVMVTGQGRVVVLDFGLVQDIQLQEQSSPFSTFGTIPYVSPEQIRGERLGEASDWYSIGVMLYQALTGLQPHRGEPIQVLYARCNNEPPPPQSLNPAAPEDLAALCLDLLARDPDARPNASEIQRRLGIPVTTGDDVEPGPGFVGRSVQLGQLQAAWQQARAGERVVVHLSGPSGVGKTRLLERFAEDCRGRGAVVLSSRCHERESVPFKALDPVVDALCRHLSAESEREGLAGLLPDRPGPLARMFPVVGALLDSPGKDGSRESADPAELRRRAFAALRQLLDRVSRRESLVVVVDDLQFSDADSLVGLEELLREPEAPPLLLVVSTRTEQLSRRPLVGRFLETAEGGEGGFQASRIDLLPLKPAEGERLAVWHLGPEPPRGRELARQIAREAGGMPLFIEELARFARRAGQLGEGPVGAPDLGEVLRLRIEQQPDTARRLLETIAIAGQPVPQEVTWAASGLEGSGWKSVALLASVHLVRTHGSGKADLVECNHDRIQEAVIARLSEDRRIGCHRDLARALLRAGVEDPARLLFHWQEAGEPAEAAGWARAAADEAARALAFDRAAELYSRCLDLLEEGSPDRRAVLRRRAEALAAAGRGPEAGEAFLELVDGARPGEAWRFERRAAMAFLESGHLDRGQELLRRVLAGMGIPVPSSPGRAMASFLAMRARLKIRGLGFQAREPDEVSHRELDRIDACSSAASGIGLADPMEGVVYQVRALLLALASGEVTRVTRSLALEGAFRAAFGSAGFAQAEALLDQAHDLAVRSEDPKSQGVVLACRAIAMLQAGRWSACLDSAARARTLLREDGEGASWFLATATSYHLAALGFLGRLPEAFEEFSALLADARRRGDIHSELHARLGMEVPPYLIADDPERAAADIEQAMALAPGSGFNLHVNYGTRALVQVALYRGDPARALELAEQLVAQLKSSSLKRLPMISGLGLEVLARARLAELHRSGPDRAMERQVEQYVRRSARSPLPWQQASASLVKGQLAWLRGDRPLALGELQRAARMYAEQGMAFHALAARWREADYAGSDGATTMGAESALSDVPGLHTLVRMVTPVSG